MSDQNDRTVAAFNSLAKDLEDTGALEKDLKVFAAFERLKTALRPLLQEKP